MAYIPEEREEERLGGVQADREWLVEYIVELPEENPIRLASVARGVLQRCSPEFASRQATLLVL